MEQNVSLKDVVHKSFCTGAPVRSQAVLLQKRGMSYRSWIYGHFISSPLGE